MIRRTSASFIITSGNLIGTIIQSDLLIQKLDMVNSMMKRD